MKVIIFGVGRSGTTALYSLLQKIMEDQFGDDVDYVYEPFLWDRNVFNNKYEHIVGEFKYIDNQSVEGMYWHQKLPMFINDVEKYKNNPYVKDILTPKNNKKHMLIKSIRLNGRYKLFNKIADNITKYIFVIRNPVDVVNSVVNKFSFFGDNYHRSDETRFFEEIRSLNGKSDNYNSLRPLEKQVVYWEKMNEAVFYVASKSEYSPLIIINEEYISNSELVLHRICDYLGIMFSKCYLNWIRENVGPVTKKVNLSEDDYKIVSGYLPKYINWTGSSLDNKNLFDIDIKYKNFPGKTDILQFSKSNANDLERELFNKNKEIDLLTDTIIKLKEKLSKKEKLNEKVKEVVNLLGGYIYKIGRSIKEVCCNILAIFRIWNIKKK